jgi:DNA-binding transcriptional LysR family regulator
MRDDIFVMKMCSIGNCTFGMLSAHMHSVLTRKHDVLVAAESPGRYWEFRDRHGTQRVVVNPIMNVQGLLLVKRAVLDGLGIARLPQSIVDEEIERGRLIAVLPDAELCASEWTVLMQYPGKPNMPAIVRSFVLFVRERYSTAFTQAHFNESQSARC